MMGYSYVSQYSYVVSYYLSYIHYIHRTRRPEDNPLVDRLYQ